MQQICIVSLGICKGWWPVVLVVNLIISNSGGASSNPSFFNIIENFSGVCRVI